MKSHACDPRAVNVNLSQLEKKKDKNEAVTRLTQVPGGFHLFSRPVLSSVRQIKERRELDRGRNRGKQRNIFSQPLFFFFLWDRGWRRVIPVYLEPGACA